MKRKEPQASQAPVPGSQWSWGFPTVGCCGDHKGVQEELEDFFPFFEAPSSFPSSHPPFSLLSLSNLRLYFFPLFL